MKRDCDTSLSVTDERDLGAFIGSDVDDYPLLDYEFRIYCHIVRRAGRYGRCFESHRKMAKHCRLTMRKFLNGIELLVTTGLVNQRMPLDQETFDYRLTSSKDWMPADNVDSCRNAITAKRKDKRKLSRVEGGVVRNRMGGSAEPSQRGTAWGSSAEPHGGGSAEPHGGGSAAKEIPFKEIPLRKTPLTPQGGNAFAPSPTSGKSKAPEPEPAKTPPTVNGQGKGSLKTAKPGAEQKSSARGPAPAYVLPKKPGDRFIPEGFKMGDRAIQSLVSRLMKDFGFIEHVEAAMPAEVLSRFERFWGWYDRNISGLPRAGAPRGDRKQALIAFAICHESDFFGFGADGFRDGGVKAAEVFQQKQGVGAVHAAYFLVGKGGGQPYWLPEVKASHEDRTFLPEPAPAPVPLAQMTRAQQTAENSRRAGEEWLAEQGVTTRPASTKTIEVAVNHEH